MEPQITSTPSIPPGPATMTSMGPPRGSTPQDPVSVEPSNGSRPPGPATMASMQSGGNVPTPTIGSRRLPQDYGQPQESMPPIAGTVISSGTMPFPMMGSMGPSNPIQNTVPVQMDGKRPPEPPPQVGSTPQPVEVMWSKMGDMPPPQSVPPPPSRELTGSVRPPPPPDMRSELPPPPPPPQKHHHHKYLDFPALEPPPFSVPMPDVDELKKTFTDAIEPTILNKYSSYCFLACIIVYSMPIVTCMCWGQDPDVKYWLGYGWIAAIVLPFVWVVAFVWQCQRFTVPRRFIMILAMLLGCIMFAGIGGDYMGGARLTATQLISSDCSDFFSEKKELHEAYEAAHKIFTACHHNQNIHHWISSVEDCPGYSEKSPHFKRWEYLKSVEARFNCAGFCVQRRGGTGLWYPSLQTQDPCDESIGRKMHAIRQEALGMLCYACTVFFFFMIWGVLVFPTMQKYIGLR